MSMTALVINGSMSEGSNKTSKSRVVLGKGNPLRNLWEEGGTPARNGQEFLGRHCRLGKRLQRGPLLGPL